jgi:DTW domain-containing protein YfiP
MSKRRESITRRCPKCSINMAMCFCNALSSISTKTHVSVIFHKKEYFLTSNTGKIANLALVNSSYQIRGLKDKPLTDDFTHNGKYTPYYLYPSEDAEVIDSSFIERQTKPINLIVPDATWRQTKKFHKREPLLKGIPHIKLGSGLKSIYQLRRQPQEGGLCTIEAIAYSLKEIENIEVFSHLMNILKIMNDKVLETRYHENI